MAEQFLTLMADLDHESQKRMADWYGKLQNAGFTGRQTPGLPYHVSLGTFSLEQEAEAAAEAERLAGEFAAIPVFISHVGIFPGGQVLFGAPDMNTPELLSLRKAIRPRCTDRFPWTPHVTVLIDEPEEICRALPLLLRSFQPFSGTIARLHLCAFWPTREIASFDLRTRREV